MNLDELRAKLGPPVPPSSLELEPVVGPHLEQLLDGAVYSGPEGNYFAVDTVLTNQNAHGRYSFQDLAHMERARLPVVAGVLQTAEVDLRSVAFIDTETTGLGYGVGTQVFLVGIGHVDPGRGFRLRQFFLRHPGEERAVLAAISAYLRPFSTLVSYNGRSFDWPLLENRFIYQRLWSNPLEPAHIDLLYTARRLWKRRLDSCGLSCVEQSILKVNRTRQDVEGWMIPQLYFRYLRTSDSAPLSRVFYHNAQDISSLAMLCLHIHNVLQDPCSGIVEHGLDLLSLSRIFDLLHRPDDAVGCLTRALNGRLSPRLEAEAWVRLALINKRRGNWDAAVPLFDRALGRRGFERLACVELAKYHEHVARDPEKAMRYTVRAMQTDEFGHGIPWPGTRRIELHYRHRRLKRQLALRAA